MPMEINMNKTCIKILNPLISKGIFFIFTCFFFFIHTSCKNPQEIEENIIKIQVNNDTLNMNGIKPFITGTSWTYLVKKYNNMDSLISDTVIKVTLIKDTIIDSLRWYKTSYETGYWQTNHTDGLRYRLYVAGNPVIEWLEAKYNTQNSVTVGYIWQKPSAQVTVISVDSSKNVPAGIFKCYLYYEIISKGSDFNYKNSFYCPKTGLVYSEYYIEKSGAMKYISETWELIDFKIGNK